jgi:RNA polymerase sigma-70 factor (ECF subfamily)
MSYPLDKKAQIHSELALLTPRLAAFASALTGSEAASSALIKATRNQAAARAKERGHTPLVLWLYGIMHALWAARMKGGAQAEQSVPADPRLFLPRSATSGPDAAGAGRMAKFVAQLPASQRAALYLAYGERLSYDEVAEVCGVPVGTVMTRLARAHAALIQRQEIGSIPATATAPRAAEQGRDWAAA